MADVGRLAGVSSTTVSFVINDRAGEAISPPTRRRVLDAVEQLGYRPNRAAQGLRTRRTATIGFVIDERNVEPFAGKAISGAHDVAWRHGSVLLVVNSMRSRQVLEAAIDDLVDRQVDTIIFAVSGTRRVALPESLARRPCVLLNCFAPGSAVPCILPDEVAGGRSAAQMLLDAGHTEIAFVTGESGAWATRARLRGHREALRAAGIDPKTSDVLTGNYHADSGYQLTSQLLGQRRRPTGLVCGNDRMAFGAYLAIAEAGLRVPHDISVVGYDDQDPMLAEICPPLASVRLPFYEMGRWAAEQLFSGSLGELPARTYQHCPPVPRDSVAAPPSHR